MSIAEWKQCEQRVQLPSFEVSDHELRVHALLVTNAGHPLTVVGACDAAMQEWIVELAMRLERNAPAGCVAFMAQWSDGVVEYGYAAGKWAVDLYRWVIRTKDVPAVQKNRILGLLLGFSAESIGHMEEACAKASAACCFGCLKAA